LESLIAAGAFDSMMPEGSTAGEWRPRLFAAIDSALAQGLRASEDRMMGQSGLFGVADGETAVAETLPVVPAWPQDEVARREKLAVGFYLSAHPLDNFAGLLAGMRLKSIAEYDDLQSGQMVKLAGMISGLQVRTSKRGNRFAQFRFEDRSGGIKGVVLGENFNKLSMLLADDGLFIAEGQIEAPEGQDPTLKVTDLRSLYEAEAMQARTIDITVPDAREDMKFLEDLYHLLERDRGHCGVSLNVAAGPARVKLIAADLSIAPSRALQRELEDRGCTVAWVQ
jgi:DNA polymerase-3 subunit alpha